MEFISWKNNYSVGYETIDNQHKKLIQLINDLYEAYMNKTNSVSIERITSELTEYVNLHFSEEEKLFETHNYSETEEHIKEHRIFVSTIEDILLKNKDNQKILSTRITSFLQKWLINHILEVDIKYKGLLGDK